VPSNELVNKIHDRMPAILEPAGYDRWLGIEPDPHDLLISYPAEHRDAGEQAGER
jgi:putative SOS response-associated peptidase YedK